MVAPKKNDSKYVWYRYPHRTTFLSISSSAKIIGISKSSLQKKVESGRVPFVKINDRAFMEEVTVYLERMRRDGKKEIDVVYLYEERNGIEFGGTFYIGSQGISEMIKILRNGSFRCERIGVPEEWPRQRVVEEILDLDKHFVYAQIVPRQSGLHKRALMYGIIGGERLGTRAKLVTENEWGLFKKDFLEDPGKTCDKMFSLEDKEVVETVKNQPPIALEESFILKEFVEEEHV